MSSTSDGEGNAAQADGENAQAIAKKDEWPKPNRSLWVTLREMLTEKNEKGK